MGVYRSEIRAGTSHPGPLSFGNPNGCSSRPHFRRKMLKSLDKSKFVPGRQSAARWKMTPWLHSAMGFSSFMGSKKSSPSTPSSQQLQQATSFVVSCPAWEQRQHLFIIIVLLNLLRIPIIFLTGSGEGVIAGEMASGVLVPLFMPEVSTVATS